MEYLVPKAPSDAVAYFIDWSFQLQAGDAIATFELTVSSGTVVIAANPTNFGEFLRCVISGGADGEVAELACTIHTVGLQTFARTIQLAVLDTAVAVTPSTASKRAILILTFQQMGLPGYEFDATPEEWAAGLFAMDAQMAQWRTNGLELNYNAPPIMGEGDLDDESGIPDDSVLGAASALGVVVAPAIGKTLSTEAKVTAGRSLNAMRARYSPPVTRALQGGTPRGAGQKPYGVWWPYGFTTGAN